LLSAHHMPVFYGEVITNYRTGCMTQHLKN
jgi:hypothetical protein